MCKGLFKEYEDTWLQSNKEPVVGLTGWETIKPSASNTYASSISGNSPTPFLDRDTYYVRHVGVINTKSRTIPSLLT